MDTENHHSLPSFTDARSKVWGVGSEDRGGGDNNIQFINFWRVGDKSFKEWQQKIGGCLLPATRPDDH